jgi:hypothetical protein
MFLCDDVIDLAPEKRVVFVDQTVFAQMICTRFDEAA